VVEADRSGSRARLKFVLFTLIGVFNTLFDVALYTALRSGGQSVIVANLISASTALVGSYLLNSKLTFRAQTWTVRHFAGFVAVTLFGLWVLQTSAIYGLSIAFRSVPDSAWQTLGPLQSLAKVAGPKLLATGVTFIWNYSWYNKVIFRDIGFRPVASAT
jgi:putative flippase GtrA